MDAAQVQSTMISGGKSDAKNLLHKSRILGSVLKGATKSLDYSCVHPRVASQNPFFTIWPAPSDVFVPGSKQPSRESEGNRAQTPQRLWGRRSTADELC